MPAPGKRGYSQTLISSQPILRMFRPRARPHPNLPLASTLSGQDSAAPMTLADYLALNGPAPTATLAR